MFARWKGEMPTDEQLKEWSWDLNRAVGASHYYVNPEQGSTSLELTRSYDEPPVIGKRWEQDGEPIEADLDEWFIEVSLATRYYGVGYERGDWPTIIHTAEWLEQNLNVEVWYGGDSSGDCAELFDKAARDVLVKHALSQSGRDYYNHFESAPFKVPAPCSLCIKSRSMTRHGWSANYIAVNCAGCGRSFETRDNGKTWEDKTRE